MLYVKIYELAQEEKYLNDVPVGDLEFYEQKHHLINLITIIFFPSIVVQVIYLIGVKAINGIFDCF